MCNCPPKDCNHVYGCENFYAGNVLRMNKNIIDVCYVYKFPFDKVHPIYAK